MPDKEPDDLAEQLERARKRAEANPEDYFAQFMFRKWEDRVNPKPFEPFSKQLEIEEEDPIRAGRQGECDLALEELLHFYPSGEPYRLTTDGCDYVHVFMMYKGNPMDITGLTTLEDMKLVCNAATAKPEPISLPKMREYFGNNRTTDEAVRYRALFRKYISEKLGTIFPAPE